MMQKGSNEPHHSSLSNCVVRHQRIRWSSTLIVFALLSGIVFSITSGCSAMRISRSSTLGRTVKTIDTPFVSFVEPNGIERLIPIPAEGLVLADLLNQHTSFATQRSVSIPRSNSLQGNSQEAPATTMTDLSATEALAKNLFTALEDSEFNLQDSLVQQKQKELLAKIEPLLTSNPDSSKTASDVLEAYVQRMQETNRFESFVTYFNSIQSKNSTRYPTDQSPRILTLGAGQGGSIVDQQIILTRRNGERLLLNANSLHSTPLGSILLADGDRVILSYETDYTENFNPDASARKFESSRHHGTQPERWTSHRTRTTGQRARTLRSPCKPLLQSSSTYPHRWPWTSRTSPATDSRHHRGHRHRNRRHTIRTFKPK